MGSLTRTCCWVVYLGWSLLCYYFWGSDQQSNEQAGHTTVLPTGFGFSTSVKDVEDE
jgi:hypothetical protein